MSCSAPNCTNSNKKGIRVFRFPTDPGRRLQWTINCNRDFWSPGPNSRICEMHFEADQFEVNRTDGWRKLKQNATPTIFNLPKPPKIPSPPKPLVSVRKQGISLPKQQLSDDRIHFEENQFESNRQDGWKKLKQNAVPTLFNLAIPPRPPHLPIPPRSKKILSIGLPKVYFSGDYMHFEENQFELHRQDGWKKLKPNAIPTLFPEPTETPKPKRERSTPSRKRLLTPGSPSEEAEVSPKKKIAKRKNQESSSKKKKVSKKSVTRSKSRAIQKKKHGSLENSPNDSVQKRKQGSSESTQKSQKENVSPRSRKSQRPRRAVTPISDSSTEEDNDDEVEEEEEEEEESEDDEAQQQIALLKRENESMKQEISEFEKHNKAMARVILELEKHNKLMSLKLTELDKDNKVLTKKISDLERQNEDLKQKLNCSFSEEQLARMDKMRQLGTIERYIPALK